MSGSSAGDITRLLRGANLSSPERSGRLLALVYEQLREMARSQMARERSDHTLQATALVHEVYLRLVGEQPLAWADRRHFFFAASRAMQQILIEHARARSRVKRGGSPDGPSRRLPLDILDLAHESDPDEILALDEAFCRLEKQEPEAAAVVRMRFFAGLSRDETAAVLAISPRQVDRLWAFARAWLFRALSGGSRADHE
jgi:RNA polymerase sigma factor (TIGR02999 family)